MLGKFFHVSELYRLILNIKAGVLETAAVYYVQQQASML